MSVLVDSKTTQLSYEELTLKIGNCEFTNDMEEIFDLFKRMSI